MDKSLSALKVLVYFDLFDYPLTREEIGLFMDRGSSLDELGSVLYRLKESGLVLSHGKYYCLKNPVGLVKRREAGNDLAEHLLAKAFKISSFLYQFPFVRGIGISGSLSKKFADEGADIDYFVITKANHLWIARTLMHLFKKLTFLVGKQHFFCMNYYVDEDALTIQEKNLFTAIEVATLIPVCGNGSMESFFTANTWIDHYYPNYIIDVESRKNSKHSWLKKTIESFIDLFPVQKIDDYLLRLTTKRWKQKEDEARLNISGRRMGLHTNKHFAKPNPLHLQRNIKNMFEEKWNQMKQKMLAAYEV